MERTIRVASCTQQYTPAVVKSQALGTTRNSQELRETTRNYQELLGTYWELNQKLYQKVAKTVADLPKKYQKPYQKPCQKPYQKPHPPPLRLYRHSTATAKPLSQIGYSTGANCVQSQDANKTPLNKPKSSTKYTAASLNSHSRSISILHDKLVTLPPAKVRFLQSKILIASRSQLPESRKIFMSHPHT